MVNIDNTGFSLVTSVRRLGDSEINHMLREKERFMQNPRNYAVYKSKLKKELDTALATGKEEVSTTKQTHYYPFESEYLFLHFG